MDGYTREIVAEARKVARLQNEARKLRARLRANQAELRAAKKAMRAFVEGKRSAEHMPPLRVFGERASER